MPAKKHAQIGSSAGGSATGRKPWKKKTAVEVVLDQADKLRAQIADREEEIKDLRKQLQKFEEARKIFEG
jgi:septal ring factor EnvC (AmiA/AmiB activator)